VPRETHHANHATGIGRVIVAVREVAPVAAWYETVVGRSGTTVVNEDLEARGLRLVVGRHTLEFLAPGDPGSPLSEWLERRGPSPYAATLTTKLGRRGWLDESLTMNARLSLE
jgi:hypothetical protein